MLSLAEEVHLEGAEEEGISPKRIIREIQRMVVGKA